MRLTKWILFILLFIPSIALGNNFENYLNKHCIKGCVDSSDILKSGMEVANELDLDFKMLLAIAKVESGYRLNAKNGKSVGLMQTHLRWHRNKFRTKNYFELKDNLRVGAMVFKECLTRSKGSLSKALRCYNGGGDKNYTNKVMKAYSQITRLDTFKHMDKDPLGSFINILTG